MKITTTRDFDINTDCGRLLLMAIATLSTTTEFKGKTTDEIIAKLNGSLDPFVLSPNKR